MQMREYSREDTVQTEEAASAKALRQEQACPVRGTERSGGWNLVGEGEEGMKWSQKCGQVQITQAVEARGWR